MRTLVAYGSKRGSAAGIARQIGDALREEGIDVDVRLAGDVRDLRAYDAVVIGGSMRSGLARSAPTAPVWYLSNGPLDDPGTKVVVAPGCRDGAINAWAHNLAATVKREMASHAA